MGKRYTEYGLYIRKASRTNDYVVGFIGAGSIKHFPTYEDAETAIEAAIDQAWTTHGSDIQNVIIEGLI